MNALRGLLLKEFYHILRDRRTLVVLILMPLVQVVLFGYAIRTDVEDVRLVVVDPTPDATTLALRGRFTATGTFRIVAVLPATDSLEAWFQRGDAQGAVLIEPRFGERLARGLPAHVHVIGDATEPNTGSTVESYTSAVIQGFERELRREAAPAARTAAAIRIEPEVRTRFNPTRQSANLFVPGLMAFVLTIISTIMTAISISREKETGTMEALLVSPLRPWQIIVGKVSPYLAVGIVSVSTVLVEARLVFHVPVRGSVLLLLGEGVLFILVSLSLGIMISARTSSQRVAMTGALVGTMLPTVLLSGFIFPVESLPTFLRWVSVAMPARWFVTIARAIMLKGTGIAFLWRETLILAGMALALLTVATRSFHVRMD
jgi:drug efflux transport system permease protein